MRIDVSPKLSLDLPCTEEVHNRPIRPRAVNTTTLAAISTSTAWAVALGPAAEHGIRRRGSTTTRSGECLCCRRARSPSKALS